MKTYMGVSLNDRIINIAASRGIEAAIDYIMAEKDKETKKQIKLRKPKFCRNLK